MMSDWKLAYSSEWVQIGKAVRFAVDAQTYDNPDLLDLSKEILKGLEPVPLPTFLFMRNEL